MKSKTGAKVLDLNFAAKGDAPALASPEQLAKINKYARTPLAADQVYIRSIYLCHNAIDLTNERFSESLLKTFLDTLPGKSFLCSHQTNQLGVGILFDGQILKMPPADASALLNVDLKFPGALKEAQVLEAWFYIPVSIPVNGKQVEMNQEFVANIEAGVYRHVSIGFSAESCAPVRDAKSDKVLFWELKEPGYLREASLVYLGAQPGATTTAKSAGVEHTEQDKEKTLLEIKEMDKLKAMLGLGADADHTAVEKAVAEKLTRLKYLEVGHEALSKSFGDAEPTAEQVKALTSQAADGRAYKGMLIEETLKLERLAKTLPDDPASFASRKTMLEGRTLADVLFGIAPLRKNADALSVTAIKGGNPNEGREGEGRETFIRRGDI